MLPSLQTTNSKPPRARQTDDAGSWWLNLPTAGFTAQAQAQQVRMFHSRAYWQVDPLRIIGMDAKKLRGV